VQPFDWGGGGRPATARRSEPPPPDAPRGSSPETLAAIERDAFAKGYAQGERAGNEAAAARNEAMLRRLTESLDELQALRGRLLQRTERQVVELALAIARKIIHREAALDGDLLLAMARVALDRLADTASATIRLHPEDHAAVAAHGGAAGGHAVEIVADPAVRRGGCVVQSALGAIDVGAAAQLDELTRALLGDERPEDLEIGADDAAARV
jgi:flagellar assembly protein FliH